MVEKWLGDVEVPIDAQSYDLPDGCSKGSLFAKNGELIRFLFDDAKTNYEGFLRGKRVSDDGPCLGRRVSADGPYEWFNYSQIEERFVRFGAGLAKIGVPAGQSSFIGIYGPNCIEWSVADLSNSAYSRVTVALYDTLGQESAAFIINQAEISCVVCDTVKVKKLLEVKKSCPALKYIVLFGESASDEDKTAVKEAEMEVYTMQQVEELGTSDPIDIMPAKPDDLITLCYTSGTTGMPKGVMITHENLVSCASASALQLAYGGQAINADDSHISYLPLAHIMERVIHVSLFMQGVRIGFFRGDIKTLVNDIQELKPTLFLSVPRLLNRMYDKVMGTVEASGWIKRWLFNKAYSYKLAEVQSGLVRNDSIWDTLVFRKVQATLGGRVRMIVSGSAPINNSVKEFLRVVFGCGVYEGYGQTEGAAACTLTFPFDLAAGHVGPPLACANVKLRDVPEMNYFASKGEGEVCFKGPAMTRGYYKNPEKTAELFDEDGWVRSGDIGKWLPNGTLKIVDRVKHIFKLSQGEYIAPEKVENVCVRSTYVAQMFLFGDSLMDSCVAIVVPDEEVLMGWAKKNGRNEATFEDLCKNEQVFDMIFEDIKKVASAGGLNSLETPRMISLCKDMFTVENELLTPTFKLKRAQARAHFKTELEAMYHKLAPRASITSNS